MAPGVGFPSYTDEAELVVDGGPVKLTNLQKVFWPDLGLTKRDLSSPTIYVSRASGFTWAWA